MSGAAMIDHLMPDEAHAVWDILVEKAGANTDPDSAHGRNIFVAYLTEPVPCGHEFRFMGSLAFGGKLHHNGGRVYVSYYPEDRNEVRDAIVADVNARLDEMFSEACVNPQCEDGVVWVENGFGARHPCPACNRGRDWR